MPLYTPPVGPAQILTPGVFLNPGATTWPTANRALFGRVQVPVATTIRYINWIVSVQSGNIQVGIVSLSGTDRTTYTRIAHSGVIACPAAADIRTDLGATLLAPGDYAAFLWADNITFQTRTATASGQSTHRWAGSATGLASGVGGSGTLTWSTAFTSLALEGDV